MADATGEGGKPAFRKPERQDLLFSLKLFLAAAFALWFGFRQGFENPYWPALTIYIVVNPPGAGAMRSKSIFRLVGTIIGATLILLAAAAFADHLALFLGALIALVVAATYMNRADRLPTNYLWFAIAVTVLAVGIARYSQPTDLFDLVTARVGEIVFGILVIAAVDGIFWPRVMTPVFLEAMAKWREEARTWLIGSLADRSTDGLSERARREAVRGLVRQVADIDAKAVQLPFDPIARAPRSRDMRLLRSKVIHLVTEIGSIEQWALSLRAGGILRSSLEQPLDDVVAWLRAAPIVRDAPIEEHIAAGGRLGKDLDAACSQHDPTQSRLALLQHGLLNRLAAFVRDWCDLTLVLHAIETGTRMPARLANQSRRVTAARSYDYVASALDVAPIVGSMGMAALLWYLTAWNEGLAATIFAFVACFMLMGQRPTAKTAGGVVAAVLVVFAITLLYEFVVLPRVTDFATLLLVLACGLLPLGVLMSVHPVGMLLLMLLFSMLGLQNEYRYEFDQSLQVMTGALAGLGLGIFWLRLLDYDRARFAMRRLVDAARLDVLDVARGSRLADRERYLSLAVDRVSLFFKSLEQAEKEARPAPDMTPTTHLMDDLSVGNNLLTLRGLEAQVSAHARAVIRTVRSEVAHDFQLRRERRSHDSVLGHVLAVAMGDSAVHRDGARAHLLTALAGIQLAIAGAGTDRSASHAAAVPA